MEAHEWQKSNGNNLIESSDSEASNHSARYSKRATQWVTGLSKPAAKLVSSIRCKFIATIKVTSAKNFNWGSPTGSKLKDSLMQKSHCRSLTVEISLWRSHWSRSDPKNRRLCVWFRSNDSNCVCVNHRGKIINRLIKLIESDCYRFFTGMFQPKSYLRESIWVYRVSQSLAKVCKVLLRLA